MAICLHGFSPHPDAGQEGQEKTHQKQFLQSLVFDGLALHSLKGRGRLDAALSAA